MYFPKIKFEITLPSIRQWKELPGWYPTGLFAWGSFSRYLYSRCPLSIHTTCPAHPIFFVAYKDSTVLHHGCAIDSPCSGTPDRSQVYHRKSYTYFNSLLPYNSCHSHSTWITFSKVRVSERRGPSTYRNFMAAIAFKLAFRILHWEGPSISGGIRHLWNKITFL
jgi:hypothetical protein